MFLILLYYEFGIRFFYIRILYNLFRRNLQKFRVLVISVELAEAAAIIVTVGNTLVCDDAKRHDFPFIYGFAVFLQTLFRLTHGDEYACGTKFVKMMVYCISSDGCQIRDEKAGVERAGVYNGKRQCKVFIDKLKNPHCGPNEERNPHKACHQFIHCVL